VDLQAGRQARALHAPRRLHRPWSHEHLAQHNHRTRPCHMGVTVRFPKALKSYEIYNDLDLSGKRRTYHSS
jgi:hypothetical protein